MFAFYRGFGKRTLDVLAASIGAMLLSPLLLACALLVKFSSAGPVFFRQTRIGRNGRPFAIVKFRSMVCGAESLGPGITAAGDCRVTKIGKFLRRTKLDELPQLWNVAKGDMSLVGPRPEIPEYVARYTLAQRQVLEVRPGITDLASLVFRREEELLCDSRDSFGYYESVVMPAKLALNLEYINNRSLVLDLKLIAMTILSMTPKGAEQYLAALHAPERRLSA